MTGGVVIKGRQLGWMIHDWFRLNPDLKPLNGLEDITDIQWMNDHKIVEFLQLWKEIVSQNVIELTQKQLATILENKITVSSKAIGQDIAYTRGSQREMPKRLTTILSTP